MIAVRVTLIAAAATSELRRAAFPGDAPLDRAGSGAALTRAGQVRRGKRVLISPALASRQTAEALGLSGTVEPALADCDYGRWAGLSLEAVGAAEPEALAAWLKDDAAAPHGGESHRQLTARAGQWLDGVGTRLSGHTIAVAHAVVIRAAIVHAIEAGPRSFWRIDIAPLSQTLLTRSHGQWRLRGIDVSRQ
jgi:broad specificity phosphatase PhoE